MALTGLQPTKIQYTLALSDYSNWDSGTLGRPLVGILNVEWHGEKTCRGATRLTYVWPDTAADCREWIIYIPFKSQSSPGRCAAYLTTKDLKCKNVTDSDWIGPSSDLNTGYIAKAERPYLNEACTTQANDGTWYGEGSKNPDKEGIYFKFTWSQPLTAGNTYYIYIIQERGGSDKDCSLYGTENVTTPLGPMVNAPTQYTMYIYTNNTWKKVIPQRWTNGSWTPLNPYIY